MYMLPGGVSFRTQKRRVKRQMNRMNALTRRLNKKAKTNDVRIERVSIKIIRNVRGITARSFGIATR